MSSLTLLQSLHENLSTRAQVKSVFGEPVTAGDKNTAIGHKSRAGTKKIRGGRNAGENVINVIPNRRRRSVLIEHYLVIGQKDEVNGHRGQADGRRPTAHNGGIAGIIHIDRH